MHDGTGPSSFSFSSADRRSFLQVASMTAAAGAIGDVPYRRSLALMEESVGPDYLPQEYIRASVFIDVPTEMAHPSRL